MTIHSVYSPLFAPYGRVISGMDEPLSEIMAVLKTTPLPEGTDYVPEDPALQSLPAARLLAPLLFGGLPCQFGWCNGHNSRLNCLEYHRCSEFNFGAEDFILLLATQSQMENGVLDTGKVMAFHVPAGVLVECYATTLHYAPCHADPAKGFRVLIVLPQGTNTLRPDTALSGGDAPLLWARNKWLLAHPDTEEARAGAYIGLVGENPDIAQDLPVES